jgi:hypothetical protein
MRRPTAASYFRAFPIARSYGYPQREAPVFTSGDRSWEWMSKEHPGRRDWISWNWKGTR